MRGFGPFGADAMLTSVHAAPDLVEAMRPLLRMEYERFVGTGVFDDESVELLEGLIVRMPPPHGPEHDGTIHKLAKVLVAVLGDRAEVRIQSAFAAGDRSEPEPGRAVVPSGCSVAGHVATAFH